MSAQGKKRSAVCRVESLLRAPDSAPWRAAPAELHDRVMSAIDAAARSSAEPANHETHWRVGALAAAVAICAGGLGLTIGAVAFRGPTGTVIVAAAKGDESSEPGIDAGSAAQEDAPTVVLARAIEELRPAGSSRLVASMAAPMRSEAEGIAAETRSAARTVLSRLPFVSME